ncbi:MAG: CBS domain-containing protein [Rhizobiales bacterium]|nr:CBS domain-containing protein [Hyphomicrobiales bacterium]
MNASAIIPNENGVSVSRARSNLTIRAKHIMTTSVTIVEPDTTVHAIAQLLSDRHISAVLVIDHGAVVGIVSEGDLLHRVELGTDPESVLSLRPNELESESANRKKFEGIHARDVMTQNVVTLTEDASLADVVRTLQTNHIRRVAIVQGAKLVGVVSRADIMRALAGRPEGSHGPTSKDDDMIRYQIIETLLSIPGTSPWATTVTVSKGIVELDGSVEVEAVRDPSRIAVECIPDVLEVRDHRAVMQPY